MPRVKFTRHLQRFFSGLDEVDVEGATVAEVIAALEQLYPGLANYLVDERGALRKHVNVFIGDNMIRDRQELKDPVANDQRLYILQALSGGL